MSAKQDTYEAEISKLEGALLTGPHTARALAKLLNCTKPTVYSRLRALKKRGARLKTREVREGVTGPSATGYFLALKR